MPIPTESPPSRSERNNALQLAELLAATIDLVYPPGTLVRRDAHPKHHAVVRGEFVVAGDVPDNMKHGIFATPGRVPAWIRFSNGSPLVGPIDAGINEAALSSWWAFQDQSSSSRSATPSLQDFLLASATCFFLRDASDYVGFAKAAAKEAGGQRARSLLRVESMEVARPRVPCAGRRARAPPATLLVCRPE